MNVQFQKNQAEWEAGLQAEWECHEVDTRAELEKWDADAQIERGRHEDEVHVEWGRRDADVQAEQEHHETDACMQQETQDAVWKERLDWVHADFEAQLAGQQEVQRWVAEWHAKESEAQHDQHAELQQIFHIRTLTEQSSALYNDGALCMPARLVPLLQVALLQNMPWPLPNLLQWQLQQPQSSPPYRLMLPLQNSFSLSALPLATSQNELQRCVDAKLALLSQEREVNRLLQALTSCDVTNLDEQINLNQLFTVNIEKQNELQTAFNRDFPQKTSVCNRPVEKMTTGTDVSGYLAALGVPNTSALQTMMDRNQRQSDGAALVCGTIRSASVVWVWTLIRTWIRPLLFSVSEWWTREYAYTV